MSQQYEVLDADSLQPGQLCTVLQGKSISPKRRDGSLMAAPREFREYYSIWKSFPLRVLYNERKLPYVICKPLVGSQIDMQVPPRIVIDKRLVQFTPVSEEYRRPFCGESYQTTL